MLSADVIIFTLHMYYRSQIIRVRDVKVVALLLVGHVCFVHMS